MSETLLTRTITELRNFARKEGIRGHSKYTRRTNLLQYITKTMKNRGNVVSVAQATIVPDDAAEAADADKDEEAACELDGRLDACRNNTKREKLLWECLKGRPVKNEDLRTSFACKPEQIHALVETLTTNYSELRESIVQIGGQANNYDYTFQHRGRSLNIELKTNTSATKYSTLVRTPWVGYGQLLQLFLNVKDPKYQTLLTSFDTEGMIRSWFDTVIWKEIVPKYQIQGDLTYESYYTMLFKSAKEAAKKYTDTGIPVGTRNLFRYFHEHRTKSDNTYRATLWKDFSKEWMKTHRFADVPALELLQATLNKKHIWICTTKNDAYVIKGPTCTTLRFDTVKSGHDATVLLYKATLFEPALGEYTADIEFRMYWKNGGQGVHNLCLRIG